MSRVLFTDAIRPEPGVVAAAVNVIVDGGVVLSPTDTIYGLACDPDSAPAVGRIQAIKNRNREKGFLLLVSGTEWVRPVAADVPPGFESLRQLWPGPVTFLFAAGAGAPQAAVGAEGKIGIRCPDSPWLQAWLQGIDRPLLSTSANRSGEAVPETVPALQEMFQDRVDLVVLAERATNAVASTVVDLTVSPPVIRRRGDWADRVEAMLGPDGWG